MIISADDTKQSLNDLISWFKHNAPTYYTLKLEGIKGALDHEISEVFNALGLSDDSLRILYTTVNGGFQLQDTFETLPLSDILDEGKKLKSQQIVPFARDQEQNLLCLNVKSGNVIIWDAEGNELMEDIKIVSFGAYLEQIRDKVLSKKLIYEDGLGLVTIS